MSLVSVQSITGGTGRLVSLILFDGWKCFLVWNIESAAVSSLWMLVGAAYSQCRVHFGYHYRLHRLMGLCELDNWQLCFIISRSSALAILNIHTSYIHEGEIWALLVFMLKMYSIPCHTIVVALRAISYPHNWHSLWYYRCFFHTCMSMITRHCRPLMRYQRSTLECIGA